MNPQIPQDPNRIDLSSVNQQPKQKRKLTLPGFLKRKKSAGPGRDHLGQFSSGSSGLQSARKFNWARALPLALIIAGVGGFFVYQSFAGVSSYSWRQCAPAYSDLCLQDSAETRVMRLYTGVLGRNADKNGLEFWSKRLLSNRDNTTTIAQNFLGSSEGKRLYGQKANADYVKQLYKNVLEREPAASEVNYWKARLDSKTNSRASVAAHFMNSTEYVNKQRPLNVALLREIYSLSIPSESNTELVREFDLVGKDKNLCTGKLLSKGRYGRPVCQLSPIGPRSGVYLPVLSLKNIPVSTGTYEFDYTDLYCEALCSGLKIRYLDQKTNMDLDSYSFNEMKLDLPNFTTNMNQQWYVPVGRTVEVSKVVVKKVKTFSNTREFLSTDLSINNGRLVVVRNGHKMPGNNPESYYPPRSSLQCAYKKVCSVNAVEELPAGDYYFKAQSGHIPYWGDVVLDAIVRRVDNNQLISERVAYVDDPDIDSVKKKLSLPISTAKMKKWDNEVLVKFSLSAPALVKYTASADYRMQQREPWEGSAEFVGSGFQLERGGSATLRGY